MVNATLEYTTSMSMSADNDTVKSDRIENELRVVRREAVETFLDDMIAIEILDQLDDPIAQSANDGLDLLMVGDELDHLLQRTRAVLIQGDLDHLWSCIVDENSPLFIFGIFKQLLAEIIAERVSHEFHDMLIGLQEDHVEVVGVALFKLLLQVSAAMLIFAQTIDLPLQLFEFDVVEASGLFTVLHPSLLDDPGLTIRETPSRLPISLIRCEVVLGICLKLVVEGHWVSHLHRSHTHVHQLHPIATIEGRRDILRNIADLRNGTGYGVCWRCSSERDCIALQRGVKMAKGIQLLVVDSG